VTEASDLARIDYKLDKMLVGVSDTMVRKALTGLGMDAKRDMREGFKPTVGGDVRLSNWPRQGHDELAVRFTLPKPVEIVIQPVGKAAGPLSMLERGRTVRRAGQFRSRGTRTRKSDGAVSTRLAQVTRNVGPMAPKHTWSDGREVFERRLPGRLKSWLNEVVRSSTFGR